MARHRGGHPYALSLGAFWSYAPHLKTAADNTKVKRRVLKSGQDCFTQKGKENASELGSQVVKQTNSRTSLKMARQAAPRTHLPTETSQTQAGIVRLGFVRMLRYRQLLAAVTPVLSHGKWTETVRSAVWSSPCPPHTFSVAAPPRVGPVPGPRELTQTAYRAVSVCPHPGQPQVLARR